jgi:hypothetical protein
MRFNGIKSAVLNIANICLSYRFFVFGIAFSFSIYFLLTFGSIAQSYISQFGLYSCEYCFTQVNDFTKLISGKIDISFLAVSMLIFTSSLIYKSRVKIYITTLVFSTFILTSYDFFLAEKETATVSYIIENLMFNSFGSILLSAFITFNLASVNHSVNKNNVNPIIASLMPISSSFIICFFIYGFLYFIYERSPTHIDALFSEKITGRIDSNENEFGFLTTPTEINKEVKITSISDSKFKWEAGSGNYDMQLFLYSGCFLNKEIFEKQKNHLPVIIPNVSNITFDAPYPVIYFIQSDNLQVQIKNANGIFNNRKDEVISNVSQGSISLESMLNPITMLINISPIESQGLVKELKYNISIDGKKLTVTNIIPPINIDDKTKKIPCKSIHPKGKSISLNNTTYGLTSLALKFIPKGEMNFSKESKFIIDILLGSYQGKKDGKKPLLGFNNGKVKHVNLIGLEQLNIGGKKVNTSSSDTLYATGDNLNGYITNDNKIKIFGLADQLALNSKVMNLKPISFLNSKLNYFNTSVFDIIKIIFGMGISIYSLRYTMIFFRRKERIDILKKQ